MKYLKTYEYFDNFKSSTDYFTSRKEADDEGVKLFKSWYDNLKQSEKNIIEWYRDSGSREISNLLFDNNDKFESDLSKDEVKERIKKLEKILSKSKISKDVYVYKGVKSGKLKEILKNSKIGDIINFPNFISTTLHFQYSIFGFTESDKRIILKILLKEGTSSAFVSFDLAESEVIINRNKNIKINNIFEYNLKKFKHSDKNVIIYECEILN